jgi:hypothetical protein
VHSCCLLTNRESSRGNPIAQVRSVGRLLSRDKGVALGRGCATPTAGIQVLLSVRSIRGRLRVRVTWRPVVIQGGLTRSLDDVSGCGARNRLVSGGVVERHPCPRRPTVFLETPCVVQPCCRASSLAVPAAAPIAASPQSNPAGAGTWTIVVEDWRRGDAGVRLGQVESAVVRSGAPGWRAGGSRGCQEVGWK